MLCVLAKVGLNLSFPTNTLEEQVCPFKDCLRSCVFSFISRLLATVALACIRDSSLEPDLVRFMFIHLCLALDEDQKNLTSDDDDDDDKGKPAKDKKEGKKKQKSASDSKEEAASDTKNKSASDDKKVVLSYDEKEHRSSNCSATAMERGIRFLCGSDFCHN